MRVSEVMMWIIHPVFIFTLFMFLFNVLADNHKVPANNSSKGDSNCVVLLPLLYGIICFLVFLVLILLILLFKVFISMQSGFRRDTIHIASDTGESTAFNQNNALSVSSPSGDGGDNSSSTSSGTPEGSLADLSQRYASLQDRSKTSDYINVAETASPAQGAFHNKKMDIDYVNVKESQQKTINRKGHVSCDDGTKSVSSDASDESAVNYSKVVFIRTDMS